MGLLNTDNRCRNSITIGINRYLHQVLFYSGGRRLHSPPYRLHPKSLSLLTWTPTSAPETFFRCLEQSAKVLSRSNGLSQTSDALVSSQQPRRPELLPWSTPLPNSNSPLHMELQCGMSPHAAYLVLLGRCTDFYPAHMQLMMQPRRAAMIARVMESIKYTFSYQLLKCTSPLRSNLTTIQAPSPINLPS
jgi:hypothetical protein